MEKKKKKAILIKHLEQLETQRLLAEVDKRSLDSMLMGISKPNDNLTSAVSNMKRQIDGLDVKIRKTNELISENE